MSSGTLTRLALLALLAVAARANAQDIPAPGGVDPRIWISVSGGPVKYPQLNFLNTASRNNASSAMGVRGTIEVDIGKIGGLGVTVASADFPINYVGAAPCTGGCDATVKTTSILATLHVGGGLGFEQVFEASAGYTMWSDLEASETLGGARPKHTDFTAGVGYGAAYGFSPRLSLIAIADIGLAFHDNPNDEIDIEGGYYSHFIGIRAGLRYGLWSR